MDGIASPDLIGIAMTGNKSWGKEKDFKNKE